MSVDYHDFTTIETAQEQRSRLGVGDIWINAAECRYCGDVIRSSYALFVGELLPDMTIDHLCRKKACVNHLHLEQVSPAENKRRDYDSKRFCRNGLHERTEDNTYVTTKGVRLCRVCSKARVKRYRTRLSSPGLLTEPEARGVAQVPGEMGSRPSQSTGLEPRRTEHAGVIAPPAGLDGRPEVAPGPVDASGSVSSIGGSLGDAAVPATSYERPEAPVDVTDGTALPQPGQLNLLFGAAEPQHPNPRDEVSGGLRKTDVAA